MTHGADDDRFIAKGKIVKDEKGYLLLLGSNTQYSDNNHFP